MDTISRFVVRANYPNLRILQSTLNNRLSRRNREKLIGYIPAEVEYYTEGSSEPKLVKIRFEDTFFICQENNNSACEHLELILSARTGDHQAIKLLKTKCLKLLQDKYDHYLPISIYEDEYVIPSVSRKRYDADLISHKGTKLLELSQEGYPVPDFCIITSHTFLLNQKQREPYVKIAINNLENMTSQILDSEKNPLVFALRSAMPQYIPGLMPTFLNVGVTRRSYHALQKLYGDIVAGKIYLNNLKNLYYILFREERIPPHDELIRDIQAYIDKFYLKILQKDRKLVEDPYYQVLFLVAEARKYYLRNKDLLYTFIKKGRAYPSIIMQKMVWTVRQDESYPGVLYSRHSRTGLGTQIESVRNIFGEEIMTGHTDAEDTEYFTREEIREKFPGVYHFDPLLPQLEKKIRSPVTIEFAAESGCNFHYFAVLQMNDSAVTGRAILLTAIDMYEKKIIRAKRVLELIQPYHLTQIFSDRIDDRSFHDLTFFCRGVSILPRTAVSARVYFSANKAMEAKKNGEKVCFCKRNFIPSDTIIMGEVDAIISLTPAAIHVVTACRGYGVPAFLNLEKFGVKIQGDKLLNSEGLTINEGDWITVSSKRMTIFIGRASFTPARFRKYLDGEIFELEPKEAKVFINMSKAFKKYQTLVKSLELKEIMDINDLIKLIQTDLRQEPTVATQFLNNWFDKNTDHYVEEIINSQLGTHLDQHSLYKMLTLERKIVFFKKVAEVCDKRKLKGFTAGSFMLGRFLCQQHPTLFWKSLTISEIGFLLNESILFEKYLQVLNEVGERRLNRARKRILDQGLEKVHLNIANAKLFITLKLVFSQWDDLIAILPENFAEETLELIKLLKKPFGEIYDYDSSWSINELEDLCKEEGLTKPEPQSI